MAIPERKRGRHRKHDFDVLVPGHDDPMIIKGATQNEVLSMLRYYKRQNKGTQFTTRTIGKEVHVWRIC